MSRSLLGGALACLIALGACGSKSESQVNLPRTLAGSLKTAIKAKRAGKAPVRNPSAKQLANTKEAALQVNPEKAGGSDFLRRIAIRSDSSGGRVEIWQSSDNAQIFIRNGVLVGTRGVGTDLISVSAAATINAVRRSKTGQGRKRYVISDGDNTSQNAEFECSINLLGSESITVVNQVFKVNHLRESCTGGPTGKTQIVNDYWVLPNSGTVKKSRQWAGPASGYFEMILLKS